MSNTYDILSDIVIRTLSIDDLPNIEVLFSGIHRYWKNVVVDDNFRNKLIKNYSIKLSINNFVCLGAFYKDRLIFESSSLYPDNYPFWYNLSLHSDLKSISDILPARLQRLLAGKIYSKFMEIGESRNHYGYYTLRPIHHQRVANKIFDAATPSSPMYRYNYYFEHLYPAGSKSVFKNHDVFFMTQETFSEDCVVYLHCLKNEYRKQLDE